MQIGDRVLGGSRHARARVHCMVRTHTMRCTLGWYMVLLMLLVLSLLVLLVKVLLTIII